MDKFYIFLLAIIVIDLICYIRIYLTDRKEAKKRLIMLLLYSFLVFFIYKVIGDHVLVPLIPPLVLIPFLLYSYYNKKKLNK